MRPLLVTEKDLKPKYKPKEILWNIWYKRFFTLYAKTMWKDTIIVLYPLIVDIELGDIKYRFFKYNFSHVVNRINNYETVLSDRFNGKDDKFDTEEFHIKTVYTDENSINEQLEKEMFSHMIQ